MSEEFLAHVFEAFAREDSSNTVMETEGVGLGLAIAKRLVEEMGGEIRCESQPGKGTEFICTYTLKIGTPADLKQKEDVRMDELHLGAKRILLVEDNELNREISREILKGEGFLVEEAADGIEAVEKVVSSKSGHYDLILMDIQMPNMDGYEATRQIRKLQEHGRCDVPIIAVTANAFVEDRRTAIAAGMDAHISKPINVGELNKAILQIFDKSH